MAEVFKDFVGDIVSNRLILKVVVPVDFHGTWDVGHGIEQSITAGLDHSHGRVVQMLMKPLGTDQHAWIGIILGGHLSGNSSM